ncbi:DNA internalization-related competence protein ComEC/Rec2 [Caenimonas koreensis DSM 17982]|uniref:DNA internalization-related competence protein ComEC/Rec2 n=1 Tax=Caenimonas koreensis DSM 17982 TaxID=1121255 RepID=A0A844B7P7_9BURK|nr:DNA internalization-related competence protein ComEC/Rec2 [Caenimonas koreensis]MRD49183.1 DNA internalization-related competence protein ComEC/Rec2 [Caenimonas koreensis DSM 17982]
MRLWDVAVYLLIAAFALGLIGLTRRWRPAAGLLIALIGFALLFFAICGLRSAHYSDHALQPSLEGRDVSVIGVISAMPQRSDIGLRFRFDVESASIGGAPATVPPQILLGWYGGPTAAATEGADAARVIPDVRAGERWHMTVRLKAPHGNLNPHGFDYELWLWEQGLQATGYVRNGARDAAPQLVADTWLHPIERARQDVRDAIYERVTDRKAAGILAALVVGDQSAIDRADWDVFRATGVAHLMSISGLHVTMFAWAAALAVGGAWRRSQRLCLAWPAQHAALLGGVVLATAYALFSGWGVPSQRTVWMLATVALLRLSSRQWPRPYVWLLACAVVVVIDPWAMLQAGFWLSFVAVGVLFAADPGAAEGADGDGQGRIAKVVAALKAGWHEQWVVTVALTPLSLLLFGQVSVVGLLANALAIPWVTLVVTPLAMGGVLISSLWTVAAWAVDVLGIYLQWLARFPFATVAMPAAPLWAGAAAVLGGLLLVMRLPWSLRFLGVPLMLPLVLWQAARPLDGQFELLAADVGQGNAVIVRTATHTLVYDTGPRYSVESDAGQRVLVPLLRALGEKVDMVMLSHRDSDHTGGAVAVLNMQPQAELRSSIEDSHELQAVRRSQRCIAGQHWQWDGIDFLVMHPQATDYDASAKPNAMSCVLRVSSGSRTALLVGDIEQPQEARLVHDASAALLHADVLLAPHHGSKTSSSDAFVDAVRPSVAIFQAGYRNRFGHPAPPVLQRYADRHVVRIDSPHCGAATWQSATPDVVTCQRTAGLHYWHHVPAP